MTRVRVDLNISLDGYASGGQSAENPMGEDWGRLTAAWAATRTFRARVLGDTSGAGTTVVTRGSSTTNDDTTTSTPKSTPSQSGTGDMAASPAG